MKSLMKIMRKAEGGVALLNGDPTRRTLENLAFDSPADAAVRTLSLAAVLALAVALVFLALGTPSSSLAREASRTSHNAWVDFASSQTSTEFFQVLSSAEDENSIEESAAKIEDRP